MEQLRAYSHAYDAREYKGRAQEYEPCACHPRIRVAHLSLRARL